jgi:hypothetical protein
MSRGACPAVRTLDSVLRTSIPFLGGTYKEATGTMLPRLQTSGNPRHQMGICLDIILFCSPWSFDKGVEWEKEKKLGENLVRAFVDLKNEMKWTEIIFQDRLFWEPEYYTHYGADRKHFTHIHIDWMANSLKGKGKAENDIIANSTQANNASFSADLSGRLNRINQQHNNDQLPSLNLASIAKTYSPDVNPVGEWRVRVAQWTWIYIVDGNGNVTWRDPYSNESGKGKWQIRPGAISFSWFHSGTIESWILPIQPSEQRGKATMHGKTYDLHAVRL